MYDQKPKRSRRRPHRRSSILLLAGSMVLMLAMPVTLLMQFRNDAEQLIDLLLMGWISFWLIVIGYRLTLLLLIGDNPDHQHTPDHYTDF